MEAFYLLLAHQGQEVVEAFHRVLAHLNKDDVRFAGKADDFHRLMAVISIEDISRLLTLDDEFMYLLLLLQRS